MYVSALADLNYDMLQGVAVCCSVKQYVAVCCSDAYVAALTGLRYGVRVAACCSVLQRVAVCCRSTPAIATHIQYTHTHTHTRTPQNVKGDAFIYET